MKKDEFNKMCEKAGVKRESLCRTVFTRQFEEETKYKLFISVSDLARVEESQKVINILTGIYDDDKAKDADMIRVMPFNDGLLRGINISIKCIDEDDAKRYKKELNRLYKNLTHGAEKKPYKHISLIDIEHLNLILKY